MTLTDAVLVGALAVLFAFEAWTLLNRRPGDTISESIWRVSVQRPLIPFAFGFLCGHFFWQRICP